MTKTLTQYLMTACSLTGLLLSGYLTYFSSQAQLVCDLSALLNCDAVLGSVYSKVYGVPVSAFGLIWFSLAATLSFTSFFKTIPSKLFLSWSIVGVLSVTALVYTEVFLIGAICLLCTATHILVIVFLALSLVYWIRKKSRGLLSISS